ncbi:MAG: hypothetical protein O2816_12570 [Planctomycetota bacterium]|nr:hypothetical protein [Planctomycetota bacterium]
MHPSLLLLPALLAPCFQDDEHPDPARRDRVQAYYGQVTEMLSAHRSVAQVHPPDPAEVKLRAALQATTVPRFSVDAAESLTEVTGMLSALTGVPIVVDPWAENAVLDEGIVYSIEWANPSSLERVLDLMAELSGEEVDWIVREGTVLFTVGASALRPVTHLHHVGDLATLFEVEDLAVMALENVAPASWELEGVWIECVGPFLMIGHSRDVQLGVESFLQRLREFRESLAQAPSFAPGPSDGVHHATLGRLESVRLIPNFNEASILDTAMYLQRLTGINFLVSTAVVEELDEEETTLSLRLAEMNVRGLLDFIGEVRPALAWSIVDGIVHIQTCEEVRGDKAFELYDVRSIVLPGDLEFALRPGFEDTDDVYEALVMSADLLEEVIRNNIAVESWDLDPYNSLRITEGGILLINQSPAVHSEIRAQLLELQAIADVMLEVQRRLAGKR